MGVGRSSQRQNLDSGNPVWLKKKSLSVSVAQAVAGVTVNFSTAWVHRHFKTPLPPRAASSSGLRGQFAWQREAF